MKTNNNLLTISNELMDLRNNEEISFCEKFIVVSAVGCLADHLGRSLSCDELSEDYKLRMLEIIEKTNTLIFNLKN